MVNEAMERIWRKKKSWPNPGKSKVFAWRYWEEPGQTSDKMKVFRPTSKPNTNPDRHRYTNLRVTLNYTTVNCQLLMQTA